MMHDAEVWWALPNLRMAACNHHCWQEPMACRIVRAFVRKATCQAVRTDSKF